MRIFLIILCVSLSLNSFAKSYEPVDENTYLQPKSLSDKIAAPFKKIRKKKKCKQDYMYRTTSEWLWRTRSTPLDERENPKAEVKQNKKLTKVLQKNAYLVPYNDPAGGSEVDLSSIIHYKTYTSNGVSDSKFDKLAYTKYYMYPNDMQITSELFVTKLDKNKTRIKRIENANILLSKKDNNLKSSMESYRQDFYSALTIVDWSKDSNYLLVKEKLGSFTSGIFRTKLYNVRVDEDGEQLYYNELNFEDTIKDFWLQKSGINLNFYRWDIHPLGYLKDDCRKVAVYSWGYDKNNSKIYLGLWAIDVDTFSVTLLSDTNFNAEIQANGVMLKYEI